MRVSSRGGTIVYRDPRIARMIGNPDTHWFYETNGDSLGNNLYANVFHLHRIWVNAPVLDQAPGWGITETLQVNSNATSVLAAVQTPLDPAASLATPVSGKAGQKIQLATISCGLLPSVGSHAKTTVHGNFPTGSPKTLVLQRQGIEIWSSGNLNDSGEWTLETQYVRQGPESYQLHIRYGSDATRRSGFHSLSTIDSSGLSFDLKGTSGNDGDIVVRSALNHAPQP